LPDFAPLLERAFQLDLQEDAYDVTAVEGTIPAFVRGTYYLNGPARFERDGLRYRHWLDGDGMVCAVRIGPDRFHFASRFVRSKKFVTEEASRRPIFRAFGTAFPGDRLKRGIATESPVNVSVYPFRGTLLAFGEQTLPQELDPVTLQARGPFDFDGQLNEISPFAAHPKFDPSSGELLNFGVSFSATEPCLYLYRFTPRGELVYRKRIPLPYPCSLHDFGLSPGYAVFYLSPYLLNLDRLRHEGQTTMDSLTWEPERASHLLVVARDSGREHAIIPIGLGYCLHQINTFEEDGRLTVDLVEFKRPIYDQYQVVPNLFSEVPEGRPVRLVVDPVRGALLERRELAYRMAPDFPSISPDDAGRPYADFWALGISATGRPGRKFFDQLVHARWPGAGVLDVYQAPPLHYLGGEPAFVGNPSEPTEGAIICPVFDAEHRATSFAVFDAIDVARGPMAAVRLKAPIHLGFHSAFHKEEDALTREPCESPLSHEP
jgi:all-trans-8'-apo-beta-carotenal 15,15'-oxygenase